MLQLGWLYSKAYVEESPQPAMCHERNYIRNYIPLSPPNILAEVLQRYNSPADWARKMFKPSTDSGNLLVEKEKIVHFGFGVLWGDVTRGGVLAFFCLVYAALDANPMSQFFGELDDHPSL